MDVSWQAFVVFCYISIYSDGTSTPSTPNRCCLLLGAAQSSRWGYVFLHGELLVVQNTTLTHIHGRCWRSQVCVHTKKALEQVPKEDSLGLGKTGVWHQRCFGRGSAWGVVIGLDDVTRRLGFCILAYKEGMGTREPGTGSRLHQCWRGQTVHSINVYITKTEAVRFMC